MELESRFTAITFRCNSQHLCFSIFPHPPTSTSFFYVHNYKWGKICHVLYQELLGALWPNKIMTISQFYWQMTLPFVLIVWICSFCDWNRHPDSELLVHTLSHRSIHTCFNRHVVFSGDVMLLTDKPCYGVFVIFVELSNYPSCDIDRTACVFPTIHSSLEQPNKTLTCYIHPPPPSHPAPEMVSFV